MENNWKSRLQEYCQKQKLRLPNYRIVQELDASNSIGFQVEVEVHDQCYISDENCSSKKSAEQSAAQKAYTDLIGNSLELGNEEPHVDTGDPSQHMPAEYADTEQFIVDMIEGDGGRIRRVRPPNQSGLYRLEITGGYRYCDNVKRHHKKNQIIFLVDPVNKYYCQRCYDPACKGFQSARQKILLKSNDNTSQKPIPLGGELPYEVIPFHQNPE